MKIKEFEIGALLPRKCLLTIVFLERVPSNADKGIRIITKIWKSHTCGLDQSLVDYWGITYAHQFS